MKVLKLLAIALCMVSCVNLEWDEKKQENINNSYFSKMVGHIDPSHNWNLSKEGTVYVSTSEPSEIRVYTGNDVSSLTAVKTVDGEGKISFDIRYGIDKVYVENRKSGEVKVAHLGSEVGFTGTRSYGGNSDVSVTQTDYLYYNYASIRKDVYNQKFTSPESETDMFISNNTFTLYPVWYTSESGNQQEFGLYYYEDGRRVEVMLYKNDKSEDCFQYFPNYNNYSDKDKDYTWKTYSDAHMESLNSSDLYKPYDTEVMNLRIKGFKVHVNPDVKFGFYIKGNDNPTKYYSQPIEYDFGSATWMKGNLEGFLKQSGVEDMYFGHFAIINENGHSYLACDNGCEVTRNSGWKLGPEYFHLVFEIGNQFGTPVKDPDDYIKDSENQDNPDEQDDDIPTTGGNSWIIACEDVFSSSDLSGIHCDYDFNDVVFKVEHMSGETIAKITFLAAGSTIANYVYLGDTPIGEIHEILGYPKTDAKGAYSMLNTKKGWAMADPVELVVDVPEDFMMSHNMGGFKIVRKDNKSSITIGSPEEGSVPYMICVPSDWKWPSENVNIMTAYPDFKTWCNDHMKSTDWYLRQEEAFVYKAK